MSLPQRKYNSISELVLLDAQNCADAICLGHRKKSKRGKSKGNADVQIAN